MAERCSCRIEHPKEVATVLGAKEIIERDPVLAVGNGDPSIKTSKENTFADRVGGSIRGRLGSVIAVRSRRLSRMPETGRWCATVATNPRKLSALVANDSNP